jgi:hypothetical protein
MKALFRPKPSQQLATMWISVRLRDSDSNCAMIVDATTHRI